MHLRPPPSCTSVHRAPLSTVHLRPPCTSVHRAPPSTVHLRPFPCQASLSTTTVHLRPPPSCTSVHRAPPSAIPSGTTTGLQTHALPSPPLVSLLLRSSIALHHFLLLRSPPLSSPASPSLISSSAVICGVFSVNWFVFSGNSSDSSSRSPSLVPISFSFSCSPSLVGFSFSSLFASPRSLSHIRFSFSLPVLPPQFSSAPVLLLLQFSSYPNYSPAPILLLPWFFSALCCSSLPLLRRSPLRFSFILLTETKEKDGQRDRVLLGTGTKEGRWARGDDRQKTMAAVASKG